VPTPGSSTPPVPPTPPGPAPHQPPAAAADGAHPVPPPAPPAADARRTSGRLARGVFWPSVVIIGFLAGFAILFPDAAEQGIGAVQSGVIGAFGWYYVLLVAGFVGFALWMGFGRLGDITLGRDDEEPEFGIGSWFAMLFAAGMGIGLVFWGVAEPLSHFASPKPGVDGTATQVAQTAMAQTYVHWGIHAWAIYVVVGLGLAYAIHRKGRPVSIRWALEPLLGDRVRGRLGDAIDVSAVVGTVFGVATSLGLGVLQIAAGLEQVGIAESSLGLQVLIILVVAGLAMVSVVSGLARGLRVLSNVNIGIAGVLLVSVLALGPTLFLLREFVQSIGVYLSTVVPMTFNVSAYAGAEGEAWQAAWTTFYWGWWVSWAPFVGVFIARISRGRTVRQFVVGVLAVPTLVTFLWFSVLGGSALHRELFGAGGLVGEDGSVIPENALFDLLSGLPAGAVLSVLTIVLVALFFVTSSDSGSLVLAMLTQGGDPQPTTWNRALWAALSGLLAIALLVAGGLVALQTAAILIALPFSVVMVLIAVSTARALTAERRALLRAQRRAVHARLADTVGEQVSGRLAVQVDERVDERVETLLADRR
jgi:choline/glycine/proline betaine transport protein